MTRTVASLHYTGFVRPSAQLRLCLHGIMALLCRAAIAQGSDLWRRRVPPPLVQDCDVLAAGDPCIYCRLYLKLYRSSLLSNGNLHKVCFAFRISALAPRRHDAQLPPVSETVLEQPAQQRQPAQGLLAYKIPALASRRHGAHCSATTKKTAALVEHALPHCCSVAMPAMPSRPARCAMLYRTPGWLYLL